jgi:hypothetical protein
VVVADAAAPVIVDAAPVVVPAPPPDAAPPPLAADGEECAGHADCQSGVCEGVGCGDGVAMCVSAQRRCTADLRPYCGCDGVTFRASGTCPGRIHDYRGACKPAAQWKPGEAPDYASCLRDNQCKSGICEGLGCDDAHPGTCQPQGRGCPQVAVQYCGCDGKSFASDPCPGVRYRNRGRGCP